MGLALNLGTIPLALEPLFTLRTDITFFRIDLGTGIPLVQDHLQMPRVVDPGRIGNPAANQLVLAVHARRDLDAMMAVLRPTLSAHLVNRLPHI